MEINWDTYFNRGMDLGAIVLMIFSVEWFLNGDNSWIILALISIIIYVALPSIKNKIRTLKVRKR